MQNTMPIPLLRHVVAMTNLAFPVGFHSVSMESARQAAASAGRPPGPAAGSSGVVAQQCAQGAAAPEVEFAIALRTARVIQRSEEHTSELQSLMRISYAVFCLKKKKTTLNNQRPNDTTSISTK